MNQSSLAGPLGSAALALLLSLPAAAQIQVPGTPPTWSDPTLVAPLPTETMPPVDNAALLLEDTALFKQGQPYRFGLELPVSIDSDAQGAWSVLPNGDLLWRLRVWSPGALSISLLFDHYWVPPRAELFVYNDDHSTLLGAYTDANGQEGMFAFQPVPGDAVTLEYREPAAAHQHGRFVISTVVHAYRDIYGTKGGGYQAGSGSCNVNVACPAAQPWADQSRSVARILMGGFLCSGALINNTAQDGRQLFLTANHCLSGNQNTWQFQFNYEATTCNGTNDPNGIDSVVGAQLLANGTNSDFALMELNTPIPQSYNVYLAGWDKTGGPVTNSAGIHHPSGDIKKFCRDDDPAVKDNNGTKTWHILQWDLGVTEGGSSGSPLFDQNKRIVGQLCCGQAACGFVFNDYYGRLEISWNAGLSQHLDPGNTGVGAIDGKNLNDPPPPPPTFTYCTGKVNSIGFTPIILDQGTPTFSANDWVLSCFSGIPQKSGLAFWATTEAAIPFLGGTLCMQPPLARGPIVAFDALGIATDPVPITLAMVGTTRKYQWWYRDPAIGDGTGTGLSNALSVTFGP